MKRPAFQFYPADWRKDASLQSCSIAARGLWHELLCVMHESAPYGHLTINGASMPDDKAARLVGVDTKEYRKLLRELEEAGVSSRTQSGILFSRRMVKDEALRTKRAACGQLGGNPKLLNQKANQAPTNGEELDKPPDKQSPTPSSSSSTSVNGVQNPGISAQAREPNPLGDSSPLKVNGKGKPPAGWHRTPAGIEKAGKLLGMQAKRGEDHEQFKARIFEYLGQGKH